MAVTVTFESHPTEADVLELIASTAGGLVWLASESVDCGSTRKIVEAADALAVKTRACDRTVMERVIRRSGARAAAAQRGITVTELSGQRQQAARAVSRLAWSKPETRERAISLGLTGAEIAAEAQTAMPPAPVLRAVEYFGITEYRRLRTSAACPTAADVVAVRNLAAVFGGSPRRYVQLAEVGAVTGRQLEPILAGTVTDDDQWDHLMERLSKTGIPGAVIARLAEHGLDPGAVPIGVDNTRFNTASARRLADRLADLPAGERSEWAHRWGEWITGISGTRPKHTTTHRSGR